MKVEDVTVEGDVEVKGTIAIHMDDLKIEWSMGVSRTMGIHEDLKVVRDLEAKGTMAIHKGATLLGVMTRGGTSTQGGVEAVLRTHQMTWTGELDY